MNRNLLPKIAILIVMGMCTTFASCCVLASTVQTSRGKPVDLRDLLVDGSAFPEDWVTIEGPQPQDYEENRNSEEDLFVVLRTNPPHAGARHEVYRYKNDLEALLLFYVTRAADFFSSEDRRSAWQAPSGWTYRSPLASEFEFACADFDYSGLSTKCVARARYGEFVSIFDMSQPLGSVNLQDPERILQDIDARMEKNLK